MINRIIGQKVKGSEREIAKLYANTLNDIRKELSKLYEKYEVGGKLTYTEMARYDRLKKFTDYLTELLTVQYKDLKKVIYDVLGESYEEGYYLTAWAVETDTLSKLAYATVAADTILSAIDNPLTNLSERIHKNMVNSIFEIRQEVTQGLVQGDTYGKMAKRLKEKLELQTYQAVRVVRTEAHRVQELSKWESSSYANAHGIVTMKTWNSSEDERVRHKSGANHRELNGKTIPENEEFVQGRGRGMGPGMMGTAAHDINCRCFLTRSVEAVNKPDAKELEGMTFDKWKAERLKKR